MAHLATKATSSIELERMYSYEEVAEFAGASPRRVRRWVEEGRLGYVQLPKGRRILGRQYAAFVAGNAVDPERQ